MSEERRALARARSLAALAHQRGSVPKRTPENVLCDLMRHVIEHPSGCWEWTGPPEARALSYHSTPVRVLMAANLGIAEEHALVQPLPKYRPIIRYCLKTWCVNPDHHRLMNEEMNLWAYERHTFRSERVVNKYVPSNLRKINQLIVAAAKLAEPGVIERLQKRTHEERIFCVPNLRTRRAKATEKRHQLQAQAREAKAALAAQKARR